MKAILMASLTALQLAIGAGCALAHEGHDHDAESGSAIGAIGSVIDEKQAAKIEASLAKLSAEDRALVEAQGYCPIMTDEPLGAMGVPLKVALGDEEIFVCCKGCQKKALADPEKTLAMVTKIKEMVTERSEIAASLAKLAPDDRKLAMEQGYCPIMTDSRLGSMGAPIKLNVDGNAVFVCCKGCGKKALANPAKTLAVVAELKEKVQQASDIESSFAKLSLEDRRLARAQAYCAVMTDNRLGTMGAPIKVMVDDQPVFLCCKGCQRKALADPKKTLAAVSELKKKLKAEAAQD